MPEGRAVCVHLLPELADPERLADGVAVVLDVLRATTTIVTALAAGCSAVYPCATVEEARRTADGMRAGRVLLAGERDGMPLSGFDLGNSPAEFTPTHCRDLAVVMTTTNGTHALLRAAVAARALVAGFVNFSAVGEQLRQELRPIHIVCAGDHGQVALEDALLAGAFVDFLADAGEVRFNDAARLAWDGFEHHGRLLDCALELSTGGARLKELGYDEDVQAAARVDQYALVPELRRDPLRVEVGAVGVVKNHWPVRP
jgi:2-phosphosulfolactate phosphatase